MFATIHEGGFRSFDGKLVEKIKKSSQKNFEKFQEIFKLLMNPLNGLST